MVLIRKHWYQQQKLFCGLERNLGLGAPGWLSVTVTQIRKIITHFERVPSISRHAYD